MKCREEEQRIDRTRTLAEETPDAWRLTFDPFPSYDFTQLPSLQGARDVTSVTLAVSATVLPFLSFFYITH